MSNPVGFGKRTPKKPKSERTKKREQASVQYDKMKTDGLPEYEVYVRPVGKKQWYPIGAIAVRRSSQISRAIYHSEADLLQGAFRAFSVLKKSKDNLEYGYRLKGEKDDDIELAKKPRNRSERGLLGAINSVKGLFGAGKKVAAE
ncbi:MAG: HHL1-like protein [Cyanobacteria bacterium P01_D01_bin.105]